MIGSSIYCLAASNSFKAMALRGENDPTELGENILESFWTKRLMSRGVPSASAAAGAS